MLLRTALAPLARRGMVATCVVGSGVGYYYHHHLVISNDNSRSSKFKSSLLASSPTSSTRINEASLVLPTLEALARAARLVKTAIVMATDYRINRWMRDYSFELFSAVAGKDDDRIELEKKIEQLERDLDEAQRKYAESKPRQEGINPNSSDPTALTERVLAKRDEKETMMIIADDLATAKRTLSSIVNNLEDGGDVMKKDVDSIHARNARRLLNLCRTNGGVFWLDNTSRTSICFCPMSMCPRSHHYLTMHQFHPTKTYAA